MTWNSLNDETMKSVYDGDTLNGDHVKLVATYDSSSLDGDIVSSFLNLRAIDSDNATTEFWVFPGVGSRLSVDTYILGRNATLEADFTVVTDSDSTYTCHYDSITINNFFAPRFQETTIDSTTAVISILWILFDLNSNDNHSSDIFLTSDNGETFQLLMFNISGNSAEWDSGGFLTREYMIKVRVTDSTGLSSEIVSYPFFAGTVNSGGGPWGPPVIPFVSTWAGPNHISYNWGSIGNVLSWNPVANTDGEYVITRNGTEVTRDDWSGGEILLNIDGLLSGVYRYDIRMSSIDGHRMGTDYVIVNVDPVPSPLLVFSFAVTGASLGIIYIGLLKIYTNKRGLQKAGAHNQ
ncbi:MAG: hypothetical protein P1Q69_13905 [Candidatus Thorarchaeota archaeon]|nr:hypothetical protein [Candidatus Thorarchaeota archaeon]